MVCFKRLVDQERLFCVLDQSQQSNLLALVELIDIGGSVEHRLLCRTQGTARVGERAYKGYREAGDRRASDPSQQADWQKRCGFRLADAP